MNIHDHHNIRQHFQELSYRFDTVEAICYANQMDGNYTIVSAVGGPGITNGSDRFLAYSGPFTNYTLNEYRIDRDGRIIEKVLSISDYDPRTRPWYSAAVKAKGPVWTPIYMWLEGIVSVDAVLPVYSQEQELLGVLDTSLTLEGISDFLKDISVTKNGEAFIIERSGLLVASSTIREPYSRINGELVRLSALDCNESVIHSATKYILQSANSLESIKVRKQFYFQHDGSQHLAEVTPYQDAYGLDWLIVVVIPETDFMGKIDSSNHVTALLIIVSIIGTIIICILLARWITEPILLMNRSAKALAQGDFGSLAVLNRSDELGQLSQSFNQMAQQLQALFSSLKSSEEQYMNLFQSSADAILLFEGFILQKINRAGEEMFSLSEEEAKGKNARELLGEVGAGIGESIESSYIAQNGGYQDLTISRAIGGRDQYLNVRTKKIEADLKTMSLVLVRDITEERKAIISFAEQDALRESYSQIEMFLRYLPDPTFVTDAEGKTLIWNQAMEEMTEIKSEEMTGNSNFMYSDSVHHLKYPNLIDYALHPELSHEEMYPYIERSGNVVGTSFWEEIRGERKYLSVIAARIYDNYGQVAGVIESIRDITSHKMAEEALLMANKKLNLLSSVTRHDINNKIMICQGHLYLLEEAGLSSEDLESLSAIKRSLGEIEHFISFTKTYQELGLKVPVWHNVGETFNRMGKDIQTGDIIVNNSISGIYILADPLFEKVCYNLLENAVRHGDQLTRINISAEESDLGLKIFVEDDGPGILEEVKEMIFNRGYGKNTGFGLFLAREILSLSEITIFERGEYGAGCRFEIDVPKGKYRKDE